MGKVEKLFCTLCLSIACSCAASRAARLGQKKKDKATKKIKTSAGRMKSALGIKKKQEKEKKTGKRQRFMRFIGQVASRYKRRGLIRQKKELPQRNERMKPVRQVENLPKEESLPKKRLPGLPKSILHHALIHTPKEDKVTKKMDVPVPKQKHHRPMHKNPYEQQKVAIRPKIQHHVHINIDEEEKVPLLPEIQEAVHIDEEEKVPLLAKIDDHVVIDMDEEEEVTAEREGWLQWVCSPFYRCCSFLLQKYQQICCNCC
ncbi:uncharacterized protein [Hyperolius riggenbachi]|uniref:uncharacterized protein n=1 Tax=Hyperolius riggenbachi TaxID=752182 RepID=UPI0035A264E9